MSITITESAAARIRTVAPESAFLRIAVNGGGCSGFQYEFKLDNEIAADDLSFERDGAKVLVDPMSLGFIEGSVLDFVDDLMGQSFKVRNPQAKSSCGCGVSFSL